MHDLLGLLPRLSMDKDGNLMPGENDLQLLSKVAESADDANVCLHRGMSAMGSLIAYSAPEIEDGTISAETVEALGWLFSELGEFGAACFLLASQCRQNLGKVNAPTS